MAARLKRTPEVDERIKKALSLGATRRAACQYAGINPATFTRWYDRWADFAALVEKAEGDATVGWLAKIEAAANDGQWQAAAWKLERRYPNEYGRRVLEHQGSEDKPLRVVIEYDDPAPLAGAAPGPTPDLP